MGDNARLCHPLDTGTSRLGTAKVTIVMGKKRLCGLEYPNLGFRVSVGGLAFVRWVEWTSQVSKRSTKKAGTAVFGL